MWGSTGPSVKITKLERDGGPRKEVYNWEHSIPRGITLPYPGFQIPAFSRGLLSSPSWQQGARVELINDGMKLHLPYPEVTGSDAHLNWRVEAAGASVVVSNGATISRMNLRKEDIGSQAEVGWAEGRMEVRKGLQGLNWDGPCSLQISLTVIGEEEKVNPGNGQSSSSEGTQLISSLVQGAFNVPDLSDFRLLCEGETFHVHKLILGLRSPYFKAMFLSDTREREEGEVTIRDVCKDCLKLLLEWIYGVDIGPRLETFQQRLDLYKLAHFYQLDPLKKFLTDDILASITAEVALDVYILGDTYEDASFTEKATELMKRERNTVFGNGEIFRICYERFPGLLQEITRGQ